VSDDPPGNSVVSFPRRPDLPVDPPSRASRSILAMIRRAADRHDSPQ
jgi:hypothetical protein